MTLYEWRKKMGWSKVHLAKTLSKKLGYEVGPQNIYNWERGTMPAHDIGLAIDKLANNAIVWDRS